MLILSRQCAGDHVQCDKSMLAGLCSNRNVQRHGIEESQAADYLLPASQASNFPESQTIQFSQRSPAKYISSTQPEPVRYLKPLSQSKYPLQDHPESHEHLEITPSPPVEHICLASLLYPVFILFHML